MSELLKKQIMRTMQAGKPSLIGQAWLLLLHILLGLQHVWAFLFLPSARSFENVHALTESGYQASYLDHCRTQHNVRFGTLAYSLVLACSIAFMATTVQILYPEQFNQPVYAATFTVNSNGADDDGSCDTAPGDCTFIEALHAAQDNDVITFSGDMTITLTNGLTVADNRNGVQIQTNTAQVTLDCNNLPLAPSNMPFGINGNNIKVVGLNIRNCENGFDVMGDNIEVKNVSVKGIKYSGVYISGDQAVIDSVNIEGGDNASTTVQLDSATAATVKNSTLTNAGIAVRIKASSSPLISSNSIYNISLHGIITEGAVSDCTISDNKFGVDGIPLGLATSGGILLDMNAADCQVEGNEFLGIGINSSIVINGDNHMIVNNTMTADGTSAIVVNSGTGTKIRGNTITDTADYAMRLLGGTSSSVGVDEDGSGSANTISNAVGGILVDTVNGTRIAGNTISVSGAQAGITVDDADETVIVDNTVSNASSTAIEILGNSDNTVIGNSLESENVGNILLGNSTDVAIRNEEVDATIIRGNTTDNADVDTMIDYQTATPPIDSPILTQHTTTKLAGTANANATIDIYGRADVNATISYITSATVNGNGDWNQNIPQLANNSDIYVTATTAAAGTSPFMTDEQPQTSVELTDITATVLSDTSAKITWETNIASTSRVNYGTSENALSSTKADDTGVTTHTVTLTGLQANTTYYYQVASADADNGLNSTASATQSFVTEVVSFGSTLPAYAEKVSSTVTVETIGNPTEVVGTGATSTQLPYGDLAFVFSDNKGRLNDYRLHFVLREAKKNAEEIVNKKKAFDAAGQAQFNVKKQQLSLEKTYAVYSGVIKNGVYLNGDGLAKRFTFTLIDAPQLLSPSTPVYYRMPEEFVVASKAPSVTVYVDNAASVEQFHCVATMTDGVGSCQPPFGLALGSYTVRLVDARGSTLSLPLLVSDFAPGNVLTTDARSANFYKRLIYNGQPTLVGVVPTGYTVEVHIPQVDGAMLAEVKASTGAITTWQYKLSIATLPIGATDATIIYRNPAGVITEQITYRIMRTYRAVAPAVIDPANNTSATTAPTIQVIGPNDHTLELIDSAGTRLGLTSYTNGGKAVALSSWYTDLGTYTVTLRNHNRLNVPSTATTFTFSIVAPATTTTVTPEPDTTTTNANTNTDVTTNTNTSNTNTNTTDTTNDNTNTSADTNTTNTTVKIIDTDKDGLADIEEPAYGTDLNNPDTDGDTLYDGDEVAFGSDPLTSDGDEDGLTDPQEYTMQTDPKLSDTDTDGVLDGAEVVAQTNPTDFDSDDDELSDNEVDEYGTDPTDADSDDDRLLDGDDLNRGCDPLQADSDADGIDDLTEALAGTDCSTTDNLWSNLTGVEALLQEQAIALYNSTGAEPVPYPLLTSAQVTAEDDLAAQLTTQITTATSLDIIPGAQTVVSDGIVKVVTRTTEISIVDWIAGLNPNTTDDTYVLVKGSVVLSDSLKNQPAYVLVTFFSTPIVKIAQVDPNGQWTMSVPAELLTTGEHTAFAAVEVNGTRSEQVEVAKFVIENKRTLSNTSWLIIGNVIVAIVALLTAWFVHLRRKSAASFLS